MPNTHKNMPATVGKKKSTVAALDLRIAGLSYRQIAAKLGIDVNTAYHQVAGAIAKLEAQAAEKAAEVRRIEVDRLDAMLKALWPDVESGDARKCEAALKVMERRAKLLGLDAPNKSEVSGPDGGAIAIDDARALLASKLAAITPKPEPKPTEGTSTEPTE